MQIQVKINAEYQSLCPQLSNKEYDSLKKSIEEFGLYEAITINKEGIILDGHHRYKVCKELGVKPRFKEKEFPEELDEKRYVIEINLERRQLTPLQRAELAIKIEDIESQKAKKRQEATQIKNGIPPDGSVQMNTTVGRARDIAAEKAKLSPTTYHRAKTILEKGSPELIERVRNGKTSINYAYKKIRNEQRHIEIPSLPQGEFDIIYADPPWEYYIPIRGDPGFHYPTMPTEKICDMNIPSSSDSILFLWTTNPKLEDALKVMASWGFDYKTNLVWVKNRIGTGFYVRGKHELLLIGKKGSIPVPLEKARPSSVISSIVKEHSKKPEIVYDLIESMYPNRKYLELFARNTRDGWKSWGDEL